MMFWSIAGLLILLAIVITILPLISQRFGGSGKGAHCNGVNQRPMPGRRSVRQLIGLGLLAGVIPLVAVPLYLHLGAQTELTMAALLGRTDVSMPQVAQALTDWAQQQPDNTQAQYLLGRHYVATGQFDKAVATYRQLYHLAGDHPQVAAQLAQTLFLAGGNVITAEIRQLYQAAIARDEDNTTALGLQGIDAFAHQRYRDAITAWQTALQIEHDPVAKQSLASGIAKAKRLLGEQSRRITVQLSLAPALAALPGTTRVMVFARVSGSQQPPVAAVPITLAQLPTEVVLDDTTAMTMGSHATFATAAKLDIVARISLSGEVAQADYQAMATDVVPSDDTRVLLEIAPSG